MSLRSSPQNTGSDRHLLTVAHQRPRPLLCGKQTVHPFPPARLPVVESCRDAVSVFGKAMGVLTLQLKALATRDDIRYTRQLLPELYGPNLKRVAKRPTVHGRERIVAEGTPTTFIR